ncbi:MAG: exosortase/archaeosortase family protein, partial [Verrucomicrobiota bacterium]
MTKLVETLRTGKRGYAGEVAFGLVWFLAVRVAWSEWELNPQYQYGLALPVLCAVFFVLRWRDRPAGEIVAGRPAAAAWLVMGISTLVICAVQPVSEANPGWRLLSGLALSAAVAWTLGAAFLAGGLPWLRHFAFPSALLLTGIPWPREFEEGIMGVLIQANSQIVVEALNWCGHAAEQQGNLILLPGGLLGVEEACSGIRSLQSGIVAALCYGELLRLGAGRRWVLVGVALVVTLAGNTLRMTLLSFVATTMGFPAEKSWHDPAGVVLLVGSIIAIGVAGSFMGRKKNSRSVTESGRPSRLPASGED